MTKDFEKYSAHTHTVICAKYCNKSMTYHSISKYPTVCVLMTIQMGEIIRFQLVSNLYRLSDCKWRLIGKSIAGFRFIDSANVWLPVTSIQARAKSHVTCAEVRKQDRHTSLIHPQIDRAV